MRSWLRVEGTWLRSRLARRMFLMFCVAALVPAAVVFWLTWHTADAATDIAQRRSLRAETRFYAFTLLSRLQSAQVLLQRGAQSRGTDANGPDPFLAVIRQPLPAGVDPALLPRVHVLPADGSRAPRVALLMPRREGGLNVVYAGVLVPEFLWGDEDDIVDGTRVCVRSGGHRLACTGQVDPHTGVLRTAWELDLMSGFGSAPWQFEAEREVGSTLKRQLAWFLPLAGGVLLLALLMSLVQIRRTLVPLENLLARIRGMSGRRQPVETTVPADELLALSTTFDDMEQRIGQQMARLEGLAAVDAMLLARTGPDVVVERVASQLQGLPGVGGVLIVTGQAPRDRRIHSTFGVNGGLTVEDVLDVCVDGPGSGDTPGGWVRAQACRALDAAGFAQTWTLRVGATGEPGAWIVLAAQCADEMDDDTLHAARELADRVAIALALHAHEQRLVHQARHDALTGLPNRLAAVEMLDAAIAASDAPFAVVFIDLDRFKSVNDGLGHSLGDRFLVEAANRLRNAVAPGDFVARFGGDEFLLLVRHAAGGDDAADAIARVDRAFAAPVLLDAHALVIGYSAGVAFHPADGANAHELVRNSDVAMYRAKQGGGGRHAVFTPDMNDDARERIELVTALRAALRDDALEVHYQPRVDTRSGRVTSLEALVRWSHPTRGWIAPSRFVPVAEEHGLVGQLGAFVLRSVCAQIDAWRAQGVEPGRVAINVSSQQLRAGTLVADMQRALDDSDVQWRDIEVEITESVLVDDPDAASRQLQALRELGAAVAIDDFGTGYSSLAYLARLPLDIIKIDREFVAGLDRPDTVAVVKSVVALARALGKQLVTEGVETDAQLRLLQSWGCEVFQGFLFHRPMPASGIATVLAAQAANPAAARKDQDD